MLHSSLKKSTCRVLVASLLALSFTTARAGLITADQAAGGQTDTHRSAVLGMLDRSELTEQLRAAGVDLQDARARVAAMTDEEARSLAGRIHALPSGGEPVAILWVFGTAFIIWYFGFRK